MFLHASLTDTGLKRSNNEDALWVDASKGLFVISDGMGGYDRGEVASQIIIESFSETSEFDDDITLPDILLLDEDLEAQLNGFIVHATNRIMEYTRTNAITGTIGATVVGIQKLEDQEKIAIFHLGDSRIYRIRDYDIEQLTKDHSQYEEMRASGIYTEQELQEVGRNRITKAVGNFSAFPLEINYVTLKENDFYLLCSDGVSDLCEDEELLDIIMQEQYNLDRICSNIKELVYQRGAKDNLSMIILNYQNRGERCY